MNVNTQNVLVGAADLYLYQPSFGAVAVTDSGSTTTAVIVAPTSDADKFNVGDFVTVGSDVVQVAKVDSSTGTITVFPALSQAPASGVNVTQSLMGLGATDGDIDVQGTLSRSDQFVDQSPYVVASPLTKIEAMFNAPLAEQTFQNMALALSAPQSAMSTANGVSQFNAVSVYREDAYLILGAGPKGNKRAIFIPRGVSEATMSQKFSKTNKQLITLKVKALLDSTRGYPYAWADGTAHKVSGW